MNTTSSIALVCFGDYLRYAARVIASVTEGHPSLRGIHVGCNGCGKETLALVRQYREKNVIASVTESDTNLGKTGMLRQLLPKVTTPYVLLMDDDCHVKPGFLEALAEFIRQQEPFDVAGAINRFHRGNTYLKQVEKMPWWRGRQYVPLDQREWIEYPQGGFILARTEFLREYDYPNPGMEIGTDDIMLADLVYQYGGRLVAFPDELLSLAVINDGDRRYQPPGVPKPLADSFLAQLDTKEAIRQAIQYSQAQKFPEAERLCRHVLEREPLHADALHILGMIAHQTHRPTLAVDSLKKAISQKPSIAHFHNNLGIIHAQRNRFEEAAECFRKAVELRRDYAEAYNNLGNVLSRLGKHQEALEQYQRAVTAKPDYADAWRNRSLALRQLGRYDEVLESLKKSFNLDPHNADTLNGLGICCQEMCRLIDAYTLIDKAIALNPKNPTLRFNRRSMLLAGGLWENGWKEYEHRFDLTDHHKDKMRFRQPMWQGEELNGKRLLVHCEQGLGATLQFIRYLPFVAKRVKHVILECQEPLKTLFRCIPASIPVYAKTKNQRLPAFDLHVPLMSLMGIFKTTHKTIPVNIPYLQPDPWLLEKWKAKLGQVEGFKVGITWQGNTEYKGDRTRSIALSHFDPLAGVPGVKFFSLQKVRGLEQLGESKLVLTSFGEEIDEAAGRFMDTAAIMHGLDMVITSDTSIAHLAGAMGIKVWVALSFSPDWRWGLGTDDYAWYPSMRLFRQKKPGDWDEVFGRIAAALADEVEKKL